MLSTLPKRNQPSESSTGLLWSASAAALTLLPVPGTESDEDVYLNKLGRTIQRIRKRLLGINQSALGERVGVDLNTISRWENGRTSLSAYDLTRLWHGLGKPPAEWLTDPTDSMTELDRRIALLRAKAAAAAQAASEADDDRPSVAGKAARRDTR